MQTETSPPAKWPQTPEDKRSHHSPNSSTHLRVPHTDSNRKRPPNRNCPSPDRADRTRNVRSPAAAWPMPRYAGRTGATFSTPSGEVGGACHPIAERTRRQQRRRRRPRINTERCGDRSPRAGSTGDGGSGSPAAVPNSSSVRPLIDPAAAIASRLVQSTWMDSRTRNRHPGWRGAE